MRGGNNKGFGILLLFLIIGALLGGILGEAISGSSLGSGVLFLVKTYPILDVPPVTINLFVMKFVVGFSLHPSIISIVGLLLAYVLFQRF
jgi:hypothetical protein